MGCQCCRRRLNLLYHSAGTLVDSFKDPIITHVSVELPSLLMLIPRLLMMCAKYSRQNKANVSYSHFWKEESDDV